jgi:hemerythrin HHE cation binding domain-containing protein
MPVVADDFHAAHATLRELSMLLRSVARELPTLAPDERAARTKEVLASLAAVEPHMRLDERVMYAEVGSRLGDPLATASMSYDHIAIRDWLRKIEAASVDDPELLQELLYGLDALIRVHLWKEDELYLHMLESPSWPSA